MSTTAPSDRPEDPAPVLPTVVDRARFHAELDDLRVQEKAHTRAGDAIAAARRRLPVVEVDADTLIEGPHGPVRLLDAFEGRRQLIAYYFMWRPGQPAADRCEGCTWNATQIGELSYQHDRDITDAVLCQGPFSESDRYRAFMGWTMPWCSAQASLGALLEGRTAGMMHVCHETLRLIHLPDGFGPDKLCRAISPVLEVLPASLRRSLTWDQGTEMARHDQLAHLFTDGIFFASRASPWLRGCNENVNPCERRTVNRESGAGDQWPASTHWRVGVAGGSVMAVSFGMARYAYGLTLPAIREALHPSEFVLGLIGSGTFAGFLISLLAASQLARWRGPRAPTTLGAASATVGCAVVASAASSGQLALGALIAGSAAGWVWASYSTIAAAIASPDHRPRLLGAIATGAAAGLVIAGVLGAAAGSWRWTWAGIAFIAAGATLINLWLVPALPPAPRPAGTRRRVPIRGELVRPTIFAVVLFFSATVYFTYATDAADRGGLGAIAGPTIFVLVGASGLTGLAAGKLAEKQGGQSVAAVALVLLGCALVLLGLDAGSLPVVLVSAVLFGAANTVGSAALPIWTAVLAPDQAAAAFTATLLAGSVSATLTPALVGALVPFTGLRAVLLAAAFLTGTTAALLPLARSRRRSA